MQPDETLDVCVLGRLQVRRGAQELVIAGARLRRLLVRLAVDAGTVVSPEKLVDAVWPDPDPHPSGSANALQSLVSRLRRALAEASVVQQLPGGYRLAVDRSQVDLHRFADLVDTAGAQLRDGSPDAAESAARAALAQWRSEPLADADDAPYAGAVLARAHEKRTQAVVTLADALLALDRAGEAITLLEELLAADPLQERLAGRLMTVLAAAGRPAEALRVYDGLRRRLADELGVDPSPQLRAQHLDLLRGTAPTGEHPESPGPQEPAVKADANRAPAGNLRTPLTDLLGREQELRRIRMLLGSSRLVTVTGPGGAGKTRLSLEVAGTAVGADGQDPAFDAVWMVELAPVTSPAGVAQAVASALGVREPIVLDRRVARPVLQTTDRVVEALGDRRALLVVDNCEHVIPAAAELVDAILARCPRVRVLATSREPLGIVGEALCVVPPLGIPPASADPLAAMGYPAVQLLAQRAAAVRAGFRVDEANVAGVLEIVRRLDGLPLAIELAAARLRVLPVSEVARRLDDRFRLLATGNRTAMPRHQTLRAVVEWSWDLLSPAEQLLAERLSVFPSGATEHAAAAVCADDRLPAELVGDVLVSLVDKSLLQVLGDGTVRFRMLETIREYGIEQLVLRGELDAARTAHATHFATLATELDPLLRGRDQLGAVARLRAEQDNILAALRHLGQSGDVEGALRLGLTLVWPWMMVEDHESIVTWMDFLLASVGTADHPWLVQVRAARALSALATEPAERHPESGAVRDRMQILVRQLAAAPPPPVTALVVLGPVLAFFARDDQLGERLCTALVSSADPWVRAAVRVLRATLAENRGEAQAMRADIDDVLAEIDVVGDRWIMSNALNSRGWLRTMDGDLHGAIDDLERALVALREVGSAEDDLLVQLRLGGLRLRVGDLAGAYRSLEEARGDGTDRRRSEGRNAMVDSASLPLLLADNKVATALEVCGRLRSTVGVEDGSWLRGHGTAITLAATAAVALQLGDLPQARQDIEIAYPIAVGTDDLPVLSYVGTAAAGVAVLRGDPRRAAVVLGASARLRGGDDITDPAVAWVRERIVAADPGCFDDAYREGRELPVPACVTALDPQQFAAV